MEYTLNGAAKATGKGKSTLHRAIRSGKLSARRTDEGSYLIDASELARVFPLEPSKPSPRDSQEQVEHQAGTELAVLRVRVEMLESQLDRERGTVDDLRKRLDRAEDRVFALTAERNASTPSVVTPEIAGVSEVPAPAAPEPPKPSASFLGRLFRRV